MQLRRGEPEMNKLSKVADYFSKRKEEKERKEEKLLDEKLAKLFAPRTPKDKVREAALIAKFWEDDLEIIRSMTKPDETREVPTSLSEYRDVLRSEGRLNDTEMEQFIDNVECNGEIARTNAYDLHVQVQANEDAKLGEFNRTVFDKRAGARIADLDK